MSLDIGSVRLTERFLASDPPTMAEVDACRRHLAEVLAPETAVRLAALIEGQLRLTGGARVTRVDLSKKPG